MTPNKRLPPMLLVLAGPCPRSADQRPHTWQGGDLAELVSFGEPDHGIAVYLGRCRHCTVPLLRVEPLTQDADHAATYEARGAEL
jgi:hypothetical protein